MAIISFSPQGRMGNWMFIAMTAIAYSIKHGIELHMPTETNDNYHNPLYYTHLYNQRWTNGKVDIRLKEQEYFRYDELHFNKSWRGNQIVLNGFFQNEKYFKDYKKEILNVFNLKSDFVRKGVVSIHRRLGDYLVIKDKHIVPPVEWYEKAMAMFPGYKFKFFSDDIAQCKKDFGHREDCEFSEGKTEFIDFLEMRQNEHFINSSSTFSWIAAYLGCNEDRRVVVPDKWMTPRASNQWTDELILPEWTKLAV